MTSRHSTYAYPKNLVENLRIRFQDRLEVLTQLGRTSGQLTTVIYQKTHSTDDVCAIHAPYMLNSYDIHPRSQVTLSEYEATTSTLETSQRTTTLTSANDILTTTDRNTLRMGSYHDQSTCEVEKFSFKQSTQVGLPEVGEFEVSEFEVSEYEVGKFEVGELDVGDLEVVGVV